MSYLINDKLFAVINIASRQTYESSWKVELEVEWGSVSATSSRQPVKTPLWIRG